MMTTSESLHQDQVVELLPRVEEAPEAVSAAVVAGQLALDFPLVPLRQHAQALPSLLADFFQASADEDASVLPKGWEGSKSNFSIYDAEDVLAQGGQSKWEQRQRVEIVSNTTMLSTVASWVQREQPPDMLGQDLEATGQAPLCVAWCGVVHSVVRCMCGVCVLCVLWGCVVWWWCAVVCGGVWWRVLALPETMMVVPLHMEGMPAKACETQNLKAVRQFCAVYRIERDGQDNCPVCLEGMFSGQAAWRLPCLHQVHQDCARRYFGARGVRPLCPLCRTNVCSRVDN